MCENSFDNKIKSTDYPDPSLVFITPLHVKCAGVYNSDPKMALHAVYSLEYPSTYMHYNWNMNKSNLVASCLQPNNSQLSPIHILHFPCAFKPGKESTID